MMCSRHTVLRVGSSGTTGHAIRVLREAQGLSLRELAARVDPPVSFAYLAEVERGDKTPTARWLRDVEKALAANLTEAAS